MIMSEFEELPKTEPDRDRFGRPMVVPPQGGKAVPYTRCTTFVGACEDRFNLGQWEQRMVAVGLNQRPDLLLRVASLGVQPDGDQESRVWKTALNEVCTQAREAAAASAKATIGTALHALTERMDRGLDLGPVPSEYKPHLKAYEEATADFEAVHIEQFTVLDDLQIGGTPDRLIRIPGHDRLIVADVKTGNTDYGIGKICQQIAVYARSQLYDPATGGRRPYAGEVDVENGLIIALNANTGRCDLIWCDIAAGWEGVQLSKHVRGWRKRRNLSQPFRPVQAAPDVITSQHPTTMTTEEGTPLVMITKDTPMVKVILRAGTVAELTEIWRQASKQGLWVDMHTQLAARRRAELEAGQRV